MCFSCKEALPTHIIVVKKIWKNPNNFLFLRKKKWKKMEIKVQIEKVYKSSNRIRKVNERKLKKAIPKTTM